MVDFLVIGPINAVCYKDIFPLVKDKNIHIGFNMVNEFIGGGVGNVTWYSTLWGGEKEEIKFKKKISDGYDHYDNYDAIHIRRTDEIPGDYYGVMGVPLNFIEKWNTGQFNIVGLFADKRCDDEIFIKGEPIYIDKKHKKFFGPVINSRAMYARILIKRRK